MMGDRHEPIRITGAGNSPIQSEERSVTSAETKAPRTSANSPRRTTQITDIPRFSQTGVSRQNQTSAMRNNASQVNGDTYRRDERSGRTVRTSREPVGSNPSASPYRFSESPRRNPLNALNRGESDSSDSRVSTWGRSRTATPLESNLSERNRNPVQINPASQPSRQSIRVLSPERSALGQANSPTVNRAVERMNSLSSPSLPSRSYSAPVSRQPVSVQESARTYSAPMRSSRDYTTTRSSQPSPMRSTSDTSARRSYDSSPSYQRSSAPSSGSSSPSRSSYTPSSSFRDSGPSMSPSRSSAPSSPSSSGGRSVSPMRSNPR